MRALTVRQPWAWAIAAGYKTIENRTTNWSYRGPLAIHAGSHDSRRGWESPLVQAALDGWRAQHRLPDIATSAIIGVADLIDIHPARSHPPCCLPWGETRYREHGATAERTDIVHLVLTGARLLTPPVDIPGRRGLWTPPRHVTELLAAHAPTPTK